ncbi:unnamed protein product [Coffea canephora]|uniref:Uncharacterized protein n=1 Tax=Coffea canephora TaxID=49390 RepID=A0A068V5G4_COFCA|nr:unnamed protein product [Coffea canephora]
MKYLNCYFPCLLIHFLQACFALTTPPNITTDQSALLSLKPLITSDPLAKNWSVAFPVCQWTGVTCGARRQRVTSLNISNMGFTGMIPPTLGNLSFLVSLDLSGNDFHGQLPHELAHLRRLRFLNLGINDFSGEIPSWLGYSFPKLQYLNLANNSFLEGTIPKEIGKLHNLKKLICQRNQLSGSLPSEIFNISSLEIIALRANHLSGSLPSDMCRRLQKLFWLNLSENKFNGEILSTLSQCSALQSLSLSYNNFTGIIPNEIGNLTELQLLYLGSNNLDGTLFQAVLMFFHLLITTSPVQMGDCILMCPSIFCLNQSKIFPPTFHPYSSPSVIYKIIKILQLFRPCFSGTIPGEIGKLTMLNELGLSGNNLTGKIPGEIGNLTMLVSLSASYNDLIGLIPQELGNLYNLEVLQIKNNSLSGSIPAGIFNLSRLISLFFAANQHSGNLPQSMDFGLSSLTELVLSMNNLGGVIPNSISNCFQLKFLELSSNQFRGSIPCSLGNLSFLRYLGLHINNLTSEPSPPELSFITCLANCKNLKTIIGLIGSIPDAISQLQKLQGLYANSNKLSHILSDKL